MQDRLREALVRFRRSEGGATLVEYGIAIVLAVIVGSGGMLLVLAGDIGGAMVP